VGSCMSGDVRLRTLLVDSPDALAEQFRARRWETLHRAFPDLENMTVADLGGTVDSWVRAPVRPQHVTVLGFEPEGEAPSWIDTRYADACDLGTDLRNLRVDLVYSNAVLEHVGGAVPRQRFADTVHRLSERHWVQTPYRYFPLEPHWLFPGCQFLPVSTRVAISRRWPFVHTPCSDFDTELDAVLSVELVGLTEFRHLFPASVLHRERVAGLTKSLVAVQGAVQGWSP
jgi:hypothetical protein